MNTLTIEHVHPPVNDPYDNGHFSGVVTDLRPGLDAQSVAGFVKAHNDLGSDFNRLPGSPAHGSVRIVSLVIPAGSEIAHKNKRLQLPEATAFCSVVSSHGKTLRGRFSKEELEAINASLRRVAILLGSATLELYEDPLLDWVTVTDQDKLPVDKDRVIIDVMPNRPRTIGELAHKAINQILCKQQ